MPFLMAISMSLGVMMFPRFRAGCAQSWWPLDAPKKQEFLLGLEQCFSDCGLRSIL